VSKQIKLNLPTPDGYEVKLVAFITTKVGKRVYVRQFGKRAFPIIVNSREFKFEVQDRIGRMPDLVF
jgi:hypothetical protein